MRRGVLCPALAGATDGGGGPTLRPLIVEDAPRYGFRGLHIDLARNFHSKAEILKLIEQMAAYKLNTLHLHLGDDEGWRLQIASLPELTEVSLSLRRPVREDLSVAATGG